MARILFTVPPLTGHLNPALAVADVLQQQGHSIAWAVHAAVLADKLPPAAHVYPLDDQEAFALGGLAPQVRGLESVRVFFEDYALPMARAAWPHLHQAVRDFQPDVLVVDHQMLAGALVARQSGRPWVSLVSTSASILRMSETLDAWVAAQMAALQEDLLPAPLRVERPDFSPHAVLVFSVRELLAANAVMWPAPYHFVGPVRGSGRRPIDFPWSWLRPGLPLVLVSLGTVSRDRDTRFFSVMMQAARDLPLQMVLVAPESLQAEAPDNVLVRAYVPQIDLLTRAAAVICHAGHNTVCEALALGLPLGLAPIRDDQPVIARQVIDAGAGLFIRHGKVSAAVARQVLLRLLDDAALRQRAQALGDILRAQGGEEAAARQILAVVARHALQPVA